MLAIRIAAITLARDSAITIARFAHLSMASFGGEREEGERGRGRRERGREGEREEGEREEGERERGGGREGGGGEGEGEGEVFMASTPLGVSLRYESSMRIHSGLTLDLSESSCSRLKSDSPELQHGLE